MSTPHLPRVLLIVVVLAVLGAMFVQPQYAAPAPAAALPAPAAPAATPSASNFLFYKLPALQPLCTGVGLNVTANAAYSRNDCGFMNLTVSGLPSGAALNARLLHPTTGAVFATLPATVATSPTYRVTLTPLATWPAGIIRAEIVVGSTTTAIGATSFAFNLLSATVTPAARPNGAAYAPGQAIPVSGTISKVDTDPSGAPTTAAAPGATFRLVVVKPDGSETDVPGTFTATASGTYSVTVPAGLTAGVQGSPNSGYKASVGIAVRNAAFSDGEGAWAAANAGSGAATISTPPAGLVLDNSFVSSVGWVKPNDQYPFRVTVRNFTAGSFTGATVTIPAPDGADFLTASPGSGSGSALIAAGTRTITWNIGAVAPAAADGTPTIKTLLVLAQADSALEDPQVVWKDLSSAATLTYSGGPAGGAMSRSHGPKVIPSDKSFNTARYGDRPFPVVPVDWADRKHAANHTGELLSERDQFAQPPKLDIQSLSGDVLRPAVSQRHGAVVVDPDR